MAILPISDLKQLVQNTIYDNLQNEISGQDVQTAIINAIDTLDSLAGFVNVHKANGQTTITAYGSKADARAAVPTDAHFEGVVIAYKLSTGWIIEQNLDATTGTWNNDASWQTIGPISVSQNSETGHTDINIGGDSCPVASVGDVNDVATFVGFIKTYLLTGYFINKDNGGLTPLPGYFSKYTDKIHCKENDTFHYIGVSEYHVAGWILRNGNTIVSVGQKRGQETITIPSGVDSIQFSSYSDREATLVLEVYRKNPKDLSHRINDVENTVSSVSDVANAAASSVAGVKLLYPYLANIGYYPIHYIQNGWLANNGVIITGATGYSGKYTDIIPCKEGDMFNYIGVSEYHVAGWILRNGNTIVSVGQKRGQETITIPSGIDSIQFGSYNTGTNVTLLCNKINTEKTLFQLVNPLDYKIISWDGDSIAYGAGFTGGYPKIIADRNNMSSINLAISGATVAKNTYSLWAWKNGSDTIYTGIRPAVGGAVYSDTALTTQVGTISAVASDYGSITVDDTTYDFDSANSSARHWICESVASIPTNSKYVIIEGGINDMWGAVPLGSLSSSYNPTLDKTTFYGAVEATIMKCYERCPSAKMGWIIVHQGSDGGWAPGQTYPEALKNCCEKWGFPYLDLRKLVPPMARFRGENNPLAFIREQNTQNGDGCHPNEQGYLTYYCDKIEAWMKIL